MNKQLSKLYLQDDQIRTRSVSEQSEHRHVGEQSEMASLFLTVCSLFRELNIGLSKYWAFQILTTLGTV